MLISEFSKATGLTPDTVRFYIGKGLLQPRRGQLGGTNAYQCFNANDVTTAQLIKLQQSLGYTLNEIAVLNREYYAGQRSAVRTIDILRKQIAKLEAKRTQLDTALRFLNEKMNWVESGKNGAAPQFGDFQSE
jgi:MerR family transcriptional regulator, copper efflux regulator